MRARARLTRAFAVSTVLAICFGTFGAWTLDAPPAAADEPRALTSDELERLRRVPAWDIEYRYSYQYDASGAGTEGEVKCPDCWNGYGPVTGWTVVDGIRLEYIARVTVGGPTSQSDCSPRRVEDSNACVVKLGLGAELNVAEDSYSRRDTISLAGGYRFPACTQTLDSSFAGSGVLRGEELAYPYASNAVFYIDYSVNPPTVVSAVIVKGVTGRTTVTNDGCGRSDSAIYDDQTYNSYLGVDFFHSDDPAEEAPGDTRIRLEDGRFVVRGAKDVSRERFDCGSKFVKCTTTTRFPNSTRVRVEWVVRERGFVEIGSADGVDPPVETSLLGVTRTSGLVCPCTYRWLRTADQEDLPVGDPGYVVTQDVDAATADETYNLNLNGLGDVGHRFYLEVTDAIGLVAVSNVVAVGPSGVPGTVHPGPEDDGIRVRSPYFNLRNVAHDAHDPANAPGSYVYDFQIGHAPGFETIPLFEVSDVAEVTGPPCASPAECVTYWRYGPLDVGRTYFWRARAKVGDAAGRWSDWQQFTIGTPWERPPEESSLDWHWPLDNAAAELSGSFKEGYYHTGNLQSRMHGGIDVAVCNDAIRASRTGVVWFAEALSGTVGLHHLDADMKSKYIHMEPRDIPKGTYVNQGARLGTAGERAAPGACHLHFALTDAAETRHENPLRFTPWSDTSAPIIKGLSLRGVTDVARSYLSAPGREVAGQADLIVQTIDGRDVGGRRVAPYAVDFFLNDQPLVRSPDVRFRELVQSEHELQYYAYRSPSTNEASGNRGGNPPYLFYYRLDTTNLPEGPQRIRVVSRDFHRNETELTAMIGPELTADRSEVTYDRCTGVPAEVLLTLRNRNENLGNVGLGDVVDDDRYTFSVAGDGAQATVVPQAVTVPAGQSPLNPFTVLVLLTGSGTVTVTASSGILTDVRDSVEITVHDSCFGVLP